MFSNDCLLSEPKLSDTMKSLATKIKKIGVVVIMSIIFNGTFSIEYSYDDLTIAYEHQVETEQQCKKNEVAKVSRKVNNYQG